MKRSFYIKQLESLKSQVESLMELYANETTIDEDIDKTFDEVEASMADTNNAMNEAFGTPTKELTMSDKVKDTESFMKTIKDKWEAIKKYIDNYVSKIMKKIGESKIGKDLKAKYDKISKAISVSVTNAKKEMDANKWVKISFYIAVVGMLCLSMYVSFKSPDVVVKNVYISVTESLKDSGNKIKDAFSRLTDSFSGGISAFIRIVFEILKAPIAMIYSALKSMWFDGLGWFMAMVSTGLVATASFMYYKGMGKKKPEVKTT